MPFVELRAHSAFSFGDGSVTPEALVRRAAALGYQAIGLTDTADLGGVVRLVREARSLQEDQKKPIELKTIVGAELEVDGHPAAFLVRNQQGYHNLAALVTRARVGDLHSWDRDRPHIPRGRPGVTWADVATRSAGLFALTGPAAGRLATLVRGGERSEAARQLAQWREAFGDDLAVEVQRHDVSRHEAALADALIDLADHERIPWMVCQNPRYLGGRSRRVHDMLTALQMGLTLEEATHGGVLLPNGSWRLLAPEAMARRWTACPRGIEETERIADACDFRLRWMRPPLPTFPVVSGESGDALLRRQVEAGAHERWGELSVVQRKQLDHELAVIQRLGFAGFFLVMWEAVRYARSLGILCQGRGSAASSAVAYCLGITAVDPIEHHLLFERFLSEVRLPSKVDALDADPETTRDRKGVEPEAPDIDLDIEHDRREEVLNYIYDKWDRDRSAIICTVQHYHAPNALLDAMRALGYPATLAQPLAKRLRRFGPKRGAQWIWEHAAKHLGLDDARGRFCLQLMAGCEGLPRMRSTHVGGFVLSSAPLGDYLPVEPTPMGRTIVQFDKDDLDAIGVPKFDFLGLGALSMVRRAFDLIERRTGKRPEMYRLPYDDRPTYELISRGETIGMFQIESRAQIASIVHTKPEHLYDIVVQVALVRPGPIQARFVRPYTRRRRGVETVTYPHPALEPILKRTQGIPIFQEQAMAIAMALGGYNAEEADALRRTMGHLGKEPRLLEQLDLLHDRLLQKQVEPAVATRITLDMRSFANYGFPESHAWSFALIAYATAYLKQHHPAAFYAGLLNAWPMGFYSPATLIHDARRHGVEVRPPCLHDGAWESTLEETAGADRPALRVGWRHVRGLGTQALAALRGAREGGAFASIADVVRRAGIDRATALHLADADAFAAWEPDRRRAAWEALRVAGDTLPFAPADRLDSIASYAPRALTRDELIYRDYHAKGMSLVGHPVEPLREELRKKGVCDSRELKQLEHGKAVTVGGLVTIRQRPGTAGGTIFLLIEDEHGFMNVIVPRQLVDENYEVIVGASFLRVVGRVEREGTAINVVGREFYAIEAPKLTSVSRDFH